MPAPTISSSEARGGDPPEEAGRGEWRESVRAWATETGMCSGVQLAVCRPMGCMVLHGARNALCVT